MSKEVELKLLLPDAQTHTIEQRLRALPCLGAQPPQMQWLWNRYFDTPEQILRSQRCALRLRCISSQIWPDDPNTLPAGSWIQTFKTAGTSQGGLSQRGEWEQTVPSGQLSLAALVDTPWTAIDPQGTLFEQLQPCFTTRCQRTTWLVQSGDATIEVALDMGDIVAGKHTQPLLELELELQAGPPQALLDLAQAIGQHVAVQPSDVSKAERGYALAQAARTA